MARVDIPLPGKDKDYESRKSRARLENLMIQMNKDGSFKSIIKREGTEVYAVIPGSDGIVSNFIRLDVESIFMSGETNIWSVNSLGTVVDRGAHGQPTSAEVRSIISTSEVPQLFFNYGFAGDAVIWESAAGITPITDAFFVANRPRSGAYLNSRFWFIGLDDIFFCSDVLDGFTYNPLAFAAADEVSGLAFYVRGYKSALYVFTSTNVEYWQTFDDATFPLRRVKGASNRQGILISGDPSVPIDQLRQYIAFVGSDYQVYLINDGQFSIISDLDFTLRANPENGEGIVPYVYFIDGPYHKYLCVSSIKTNNTFPAQGTAEFTWVYDLTTGLSHYRTSAGLPYWLQYRAETLSGNLTALKVLCREAPPRDGDDFSSSINELSFNFLDDDGTDFDCILQSGSLSFDQDSTIEYIEIEMETGVGNAESTDPVMLVEYSKDGGVNFFTHSTVAIGIAGDKSKRVRIDTFGRLVRHTDFILRLTITEPVEVEFYGAYAEITSGF